MKMTKWRGFEKCKGKSNWMICLFLKKGICKNCFAFNTTLVILILKHISFQVPNRTLNWHCLAIRRLQSSDSPLFTVIFAVDQSETLLGKKPLISRHSEKWFLHFTRSLLSSRQIEAIRTPLECHLQCSYNPENDCNFEIYLNQ